MSPRTVFLLARSDLALHRRAVLAYTTASVVGGVLACLPDAILRSLGISLVLCVLIGQCFHLPIVTVFQDAVRGTRAFALALPITPAEYAAAKLASGGLLFLLPAAAAASAWSVARLVGPPTPALFPLPMVLLGLVGCLIFFVQNLGVAMVSESMGLSMSLLMAQIFILGNGIPLFGPRLPGWFRLWGELHDGGPLRILAFAIFAFELAASVAVTVLLMSRKRRFV